MAIIRFSPEVAVYFIDSHLNMTEEEIERCWYGPRDYAVIKKQVRRTLVRTQRGQPLGRDDDDDENERRGGHCLRGLEHLRSSAHYEQRKINKDAVIESVTKEQARQRDAGEHDVEALALASSASSRWARDLARDAGASDAAYVRSQLQRRQQSRSAAAEMMREALEIMRSEEEEQEGASNRACDRKGATKLHEAVPGNSNVPSRISMPKDESTKKPQSSMANQAVTRSNGEASIQGENLLNMFDL